MDSPRPRGTVAEAARDGAGGPAIRRGPGGTGRHACPTTATSGKPRRQSRGNPIKPQFPANPGRTHPFPPTLRHDAGRAMAIP